MISSHRKTEILILSVTIVFVFLTALYIRSDLKDVKALYEELSKEKQSYFDQIMSLDREQVERLVRNHTFSDEMVSFLTRKDTSVAGEKLTNALTTFNLDGVWVFDKNGAILFFAKNGSKNLGDPILLSEGVLPIRSLMAAGKTFSHIVISTPSAPLELFVATVHSSAASSRQERSFGYYAIARRWDGDFIRNLEVATESEVEWVKDKNTKADPGYSSGDVVFYRSFKSLSESQIKLRVLVKVPTIKKLYSEMITHILGASALAVTFIVLALLLLRHQTRIKRIMINFDKAQRLAQIGSWEMEISTGRQYWSDNMRSLLGLHSSVTPGLDAMLSNVHPEDRQMLSTHILSGFSSEMEVSFRIIKDDAVRYLIAAGKKSNVDGNDLVLGLFQDVTEKREAEKVVESMLHQRQNMISRIGHDLNTPLTPLVALLPGIRDSTSDEKNRSALDACITSVEYIRQLVSKTLKYSRLTDTNVHIRESVINVFDATNACVLIFAVDLDRKRIALNNEIPRDMVIMADEADFNELIINIVSNAIQYTPDDGKITICACVLQGRAKISVSDTGCGLEPGVEQRIFDEFFKADESRHSLGSTGLGLFICKTIVERYKCSIWAESGGLGKGTAIHFTLPII